MWQGKPPVSLEGAAGLDEGHQLALVVGDAAPDNPLARLGLGDAGPKGGVSHRSSGSGGWTS